MNAIVAFVVQSVRARARRILGLIAFGLLFLAAGATARIFTGSDHGHIEMDTLFEFGGTTLVSAILLLGWLGGRFPMIAILVLMAGVFSDDRAAGHARLYVVRPRSLALLYTARFLAYGIVAFVLSALIMPAFDLLVLGEWSGNSIFALIGAQIVVYGALTALLSTLVRGDAWLALFLGILSMVWDGLRRANIFDTTAVPLRETVSVILPPQGALIRIENAFASSAAVPWDALLYIGIYGTLVLLVTGVIVTRREV